MSKTTVVDRLYDEFKSLVSYLEQDNEISFRNTVDENFRKALLLAAASYFEHRITNDILEFAREISNENELLLSFVKNKAVSRQYHSYFDWDSANANKFFSLFGNLFSNHIKELLRSDTDLSFSVKAFLEIGRERNRLVHQDFGTFPLEKNSDEIYQLYKSALVFVDTLPCELRQCLLRNKGSG